MKKRLLVMSAILAYTTTAAAAATTINGASALALAGVVGAKSPALSSNDKHILAHLFDGDLTVSYPANQKISVNADSVVCRTSNVDITDRSCALIFGTHHRSVKGRKANELNATAIQAGVPSQGAAGTIYEGFTHLACFIDPNEIKQKAGGGATCTFDPGP
ncbi:MAG TPA: hypothetical protein VMT61_14735 [Candidatus Binataceae bacterium]|nr:hypothetical protein [Candidatus Binataceae bacterium]